MMNLRPLAVLFASCAGLPAVSAASAGDVQLITQRQIVLLEQAKRPQDPWPRGDGHALIGEPGGPVAQKGYHEPGGSFSPSPGSFGVSIWVRNERDELIATSDSIPIEKIAEQYVFSGDAKIPGIRNTTPYYVATWSYTSAGHWQLTLAPTASAHHVEIVFRSVGPAGGPLESVIWDQTKLLLNRRWIVTADTPPTAIHLGDESKGELQRSISSNLSVASDSGWGFARWGIEASALTLQVVDTKPQFASTLSYARAVPQFEFHLPDPRFEESLKAQVATLMMGYVGRQTGPGEPINYPLAWERDGAYSLMAMAKCGQLATARELSVYFAENDFFGGFGAEGDAPGSASNALIELAYLLNDPDYFHWVWPNIVRKMGLIDEMMNARADLYKEFIGPLAPHLLHDGKRHQLICHAAEGGLIVGSMDLHFPILYINALSYRALIQASRLATTLGKTEEARTWTAQAEKLRAAWLSVFGQPKYDNERNFMISVWPSWIINRDFKPFVEKIAARRDEEWSGGRPKQRPLWTYFTAAEAHQWLFLEQPDRTWETLTYFFDHQCAPGLFTYWEGEGEENTFKQWEHYRGWLKPRYVTPHYWTASEMLHLQLDMLVYVDESKPEFELVIGGGVPPAWLKESKESFGVKSFRTKAGVVSWEYRDGELKVTVAGAAKKTPVHAGVSFREQATKLTVRYE
jgi:hypothetical protein